MPAQTTKLSFKGLEPYFSISSTSTTTGFTFPIPPPTGSDAPTSYLVRFSCQFTTSARLQISFRNASNSDLPGNGVATSSGTQTALASGSNPMRLSYWTNSGRAGQGSAGGSSSTGTEAWIYVHDLPQTSPNGLGVRWFQMFGETRGGGTPSASLAGGVFYNAIDDSAHATQIRFSGSAGNMYSIYANVYSLGQLT